MNGMEPCGLGSGTYFEIENKMKSLNVENSEKQVLAAYLLNWKKECAHHKHRMLSKNLSAELESFRVCIDKHAHSPDACRNIFNQFSETYFAFTETKWKNSNRHDL